MAIYYPSATNQRDVMPTLYLRDPGPELYPETSAGSNMMYLNFSSSGSFSEMLASSMHSRSNCVELPVQTTIISQESSLGEHAYSGWRDEKNEVLFMHTNGGSMDGADDLVHSSVADEPQMGRSHLDILNGQSLSLQQNFSNVQGQGLSLSLGSQIPVPSFKYQSGTADISILSSQQSASGNDEPSRDDSSRSRILHASASPYGLTNLPSSFRNSKYLKAAQQLLDEIVNVQKALKQKADKSQNVNSSTSCKDTERVSKSDGTASHAQEPANSSSELLPAEKQDLQNKVTKLLTMLDEVDRIYKQYYHQMQIVVTSFDAIAGSGAAKPYTALALQTISRHFRSLRDAIGSQIQSTRKVLGEQENSSSRGCGISRLRFIDQQLRQQRAMQQFGMMQQHAWRPQRGLPETSVSVLRAWLFEHFLHPYPNDSEKLMLSRQTGLTRGQVANWFINARVRLWKPMVEEMYKEEFGETEMDSNSSSDKCRDDLRASEDTEDLRSPASKSDAQFNDSSKPNCLIHEMDTAVGFQNRASANNAYMALELREQKHNGRDFSILQSAIPDFSILQSAIPHHHHSDEGGRFMAYQMAELGTYPSHGGVSLTLGLQHCDDDLPRSNGHPHGFVEVRGEDMYSTSPSLAFGPSHLLHDFVA